MVIFRNLKFANNSNINWSIKLKFIIFYLNTTDNNIGYIEKDGLYNKGSIARIIYDQWVLPLKNKKDSNK